MPSPYMEAGTSGNQKLISVAKTAKSYYITKKGSILNRQSTD